MEGMNNDSIKEYRIKVGSAIRELREKRGYSQDGLAEVMEVSRSTISKIENGRFSCTVDYLSKFSFFLDFELTLVDNKI